MDAETAKLDAATDYRASFLEQLDNLVSLYRDGSIAGTEPLARRAFITGLRLAALGFAGNVTGRAPCRSFRMNVALARNLHASALDKLEREIAAKAAEPPGNRW